MYIMRVATRTFFLGMVSLISITFSNESMTFIHLTDFVLNTNQAWDSVLGTAVQTPSLSMWTQNVWLGCDWGLGWGGGGKCGVMEGVRGLVGCK